jgi:hypothetical protein
VGGTSGAISCAAQCRRPTGWNSNGPAADCARTEQRCRTRHRITVDIAWPCRVLYCLVRCAAPRWCSPAREPAAECVSASELCRRGEQEQARLGPARAQMTPEERRPQKVRASRTDRRAGPAVTGMCSRQLHDSRSRLTGHSLPPAPAALRRWGSKERHRMGQKSMAEALQYS